MLTRTTDNISCSNLDNRNILRRVTVKIELERIDIQEEMMVEALLNSGAIGLVMSLEFVRKQEFKLKKIERLTYVRIIDSLFNKEGPIEYIIEVNIYYQGYKKRMEINMIRGQKQNIILEMPQLSHHNPKIDWRIEEVKMMRYLKKCGKQQRPKQGKSGWQKQKEEEKREEERKKQNKRKERKRKKPKKEKTMKVKRVAEKQEYGTKRKKQQSQKRK